MSKMEGGLNSPPFVMKFDLLLILLYTINRERYSLFRLRYYLYK